MSVSVILTKKPIAEEDTRHKKNLVSKFWRDFTHLEQNFGGMYAHAYIIHSTGFTDHHSMDLSELDRGEIDPVDVERILARGID